MLAWVAERHGIRPERLTVVSRGGSEPWYAELAGSYVAYKRYGSNVVLAWWNEQPEPVTDARFERLDALMQELSEG